ncbi:MAG: hypothetical protein AAF488_16195 [Planctomycetota bacterium]
MSKFTLTTLPICAVLFCIGTWMVNAGDLTPPSGPITPTGRFGPRIDVSTLAGDGDSLHVINQQGSYYLSENIVGAPGFHGIKIVGQGVVLDLNGYSLFGGTDSLNGVEINASAVTVKNGKLLNWGGAGVNDLGSANKLLDLTATNNGVYGYQSTVGLGIMVHRCQAHSNGDVMPGAGFALSDSAHVTDCSATANNGAGFSIGDGSLIANCAASQNGTVGLIVGNTGLVRGNASRNNVAGNYVEGSGTVDIDNSF